MSEPKRWIWLNEVQTGPYTLQRIYRLAERGKVHGDTLFWSEKRGEWKPVRQILNDLDDEDDEAFGGGSEGFAKIGVKWVELLDAGDGKDCEVCRSLSGKRVAIEDAPTIPPEGCTCSPWCRCVLIAVS